MRSGERQAKRLNRSLGSGGSAICSKCPKKGWRNKTRWPHMRENAPEVWRKAMIPSLQLRPSFSGY